MCVYVKTLGNTNTDSAPCALIKKTIKNDRKLSPQTWISCSWSRSAAADPAPAKMRKARAIPGMFAWRCGRQMEINCHARCYSFVSRGKFND